MDPDPDPGGPKTSGFGGSGSGSATLLSVSVLLPVFTSVPDPYLVPTISENNMFALEHFTRSK